MSLYPCIECGNEVRPRQQALQCDDCGFWQHRICGTGIDQATYRLAAIRGRMDWLCVACSLAASNPSDQVPVAESTRTDLAQDKQFLKFFFKRMKTNQTDRYREDFPFVSPCGREMNYIRCDDLPVVFATIIEDPDDNNTPGVLTFSGIGDILTFPFEPEKVCMLPESGRIYHPGPEKVGGVALIKSSLAIELSPYFEYRKGTQDNDPPTHLNWKGICYELNNSMWKFLRSAEVDKLMKRTNYQ